MVSKLVPALPLTSRGERGSGLQEGVLTAPLSTPLLQLHSHEGMGGSIQGLQAALCPPASSESANMGLRPQRGRRGCARPSEKPRALPRPPEKVSLGGVGWGRGPEIGGSGGIIFQACRSQEAACDWFSSCFPGVGTLPAPAPSRALPLRAPHSHGSAAMNSSGRGTSQLLSLCIS